MALTVATRGTNATNTAGQSTLVISPTSNIPAGDRAVLCLSYDNSGTAGADPLSGVTDSKGNVWGNYNGTSSALGQNLGICGRTADAVITSSSGLTTSDTITVAFGGTTTVARAWALVSITAGSGMVASPYATGAAAQTSGTPSITTGTIEVGSVTVAFIAREGNGTRTADGDATNGTWTNAQKAGVGTTTSGAEIICETKIQTTAQSTQTYNPTFGGTSRDGVNCWVKYTEESRAAAGFPDAPMKVDPHYPQLLPR